MTMKIKIVDKLISDLESSVPADGNIWDKTMWAPGMWETHSKVRKLIKDTEASV